MAALRYPAAQKAFAALLVLVTLVSLAAAREPGPVNKVDFYWRFPIVFFDSVALPYGYSYMVGRGGANLLFGDTGPVFESLDVWNGTDTASLICSVRLEGASSSTPVGRTGAGTFNFYRGSDSSKWLEGIKAYEKIDYAAVYPGIDLRVNGGKAACVYEFRLAPGTSLDAIQITTEGAPIATNGVTLTTGNDWPVYIEELPVVCQDTAAGRVTYETAFHLVDEDTYGYDTPSGLDPSLPTVVEVRPGWRAEITGFVQSTSSGCCGIAAKGNRLTEIATVIQCEVPTLIGPREQRHWDTAVLVTGTNPGGTLAWCTMLNGQMDGSGESPDDAMELAYGLAVARDGSAWVTGQTCSADFPVLNAFQPNPGGNAAYGDAFISRVSGSGKLIFSSYLGGNRREIAYNLALDPRGNAYIAGSTDSVDFPAPNGAVHGAYNREVFVSKVTPAGRNTWGYCFGGGSARDIALDRRGGIWVCGETSMAEFPVPGGFDTTFEGMREGFVARLTVADGLTWASFLGGARLDTATAIEVDRRNNVWVAGYTASGDFPVTGPATSRDGYKGFLTRIGPDGSLRTSEYIDSVMNVWISSMDRTGNLWSGGEAFAEGLASLDEDAPENANAYVMKVTQSGRIAWTEAFVATGPDDGQFWPTGILVQPNQKVFVSCGYR